MVLAATYLWRFLGAVFSRRIDPEGAVFQWISCVSYAMLAGLITRMVVMPAGPLADVPVWISAVCVVVGVVMFFTFKRQVLAGVGTGLAVFGA